MSIPKASTVTNIAAPYVSTIAMYHVPQIYRKMVVMYYKRTVHSPKLEHGCRINCAGVPCLVWGWRTVMFQLRTTLVGPAGLAKLLYRDGYEAFKGLIWP